MKRSCSVRVGARTSNWKLGHNKSIRFNMLGAKQNVRYKVKGTLCPSFTILAFMNSLRANQNITVLKCYP